MDFKAAFERLLKAGKAADAIQMMIWAWLLISPLAATGLAVIQQGATLSIAIAAAAGLLIGLVPFAISRSLSGKAPSEVAARNHGLDQIEYHAVVIVRQTGLHVTLRETLRAVESTSRITVTAMLTGSCTLTRRLLSPGTISGPVEELEKLVWEISLPRPLAPGETYVLHQTLETIDPDATMKPFFGSTTSIYRKYGRLHIEVTFEGWRPTSVLKNQQPEGGRDPEHFKRENLYLDETNSVSWDEEKMEIGISYLVSWTRPPILKVN